MTRLCIVGMDPGENESALVSLVPAPNRRVAVRRSAMVRNSAMAFAAYLEEEQPVAVAIETAAGYAFAPFRVPGLLAQNVAAGEMSGVAYTRGVTAMRTSADVWRKAVVGSLKKGQKYDALLVRALPLFVVGLDASNVHTRDAAGVGYWGALQIWRRRAA